MARIIPARPLSDLGPDLLAPMLALEAGLKDDCLLLQDWNGGLAVLGPGLVACHAVRASRMVRGLSVAGKAVVSLDLDGPEARQDLVAAVRAVMSGPGEVLGVADLVRVIGEVSPNGTPYEDGLPPAQVSWRMERSLPPEMSSLFDSPIVNLLRNAAENVVQDLPVFIQGVRIDAQSLSEPDRMLAAVALAAAIVWSPVVASAEGMGGFSLRLRRSRNAPCGYVVTGLKCSSPLLMVLPFMDVIRQASTPKGFVMDECYRRFVSWMEAHDHDTEGAEDIDINMLDMMDAEA